MKIRAAVLEEFGQPLVVQDVELAGPEGRRGARARRGLRRLPHRPLHRERRRSDGLRAVRARPRGRGRRRGDRRGRHERAPGRPRDHAVRARVRRVHPLPQPAHEPLPRDPRPAGPRPPARRHDAPLARRRAAAPLHGHLDVRRGHRDARDRAREGRPRGAAGGREHLRLRPLDRSRRRHVHRQGRGGLDLRRLRLRPRRPRRDRRAAGCRAPSGSSRSTSPRSGSRWRATTAPPTRCSPATTSCRRCATRPSASAATTRSRPPASSRSCARPSSRRARPGASPR